MIDFSLILSLLSLGVSGYALYRGGPPGPPGPKGETVVFKLADPVRSVSSIADTRPKFMTKEGRREQIAKQAEDPEYQDNLEKLRIKLRDESGLIKPDFEAQMDQVDWRRRNSR